MAKKSQKTKTITLVIEPPFTTFGVLTFGGSKDGGLSLTSKHLVLHDQSVIYVGENGGVEELTRPEAKIRGVLKTKRKSSEQDDDT